MVGDLASDLLCVNRIEILTSVSTRSFMSNTSSCNVGNVETTLVVLNGLLACSVFYLEAPSIVPKCFVERLRHHIAAHIAKFLSSWACVKREDERKRLNQPFKVDINSTRFDFTHHSHPSASKLQNVVVSWIDISLL